MKTSLQISKPALCGQSTFIMTTVDGTPQQMVGENGIGRANSPKTIELVDLFQ
jgi:hypothetical protein